MRISKCNPIVLLFFFIYRIYIYKKVCPLFLIGLEIRLTNIMYCGLILEKKKKRQQQQFRSESLHFRFSGLDGHTRSLNTSHDAIDAHPAESYIFVLTRTTRRIKIHR